MKQEQRREMRIKQRERHVVRILTILLLGHSQT